MARYNKLKIIIDVGEAKTGGDLGANLSPYLYSSNMLDFCKKFNEFSLAEYEVGVSLMVHFFCDVQQKMYTFNIRGIPCFDLIRSFVGQEFFFSILDFISLVNFVMREKSLNFWGAVREVLLKFLVYLGDFVDIIMSSSFKELICYLYYKNIYLELMDDFFFDTPFAFFFDLLSFEKRLLLGLYG